MEETNCLYSETCLNWYSFGPKKNIGLDKVSDYTGYHLLHWAILFIKIWNTYTPKSINYINNYVVYCCLDMYSISYQITQLLVFLIMPWNQLVVVFLRKQLMDMTNSS